MAQPKRIFEAQKEWQREEARQVGAKSETSTFIQVGVAGSEFLIPIEEVREVAELPILRPYPLSLEGQVGIANIRGSVIPVLSMACFFDSASGKREKLMGRRLVVLTCRSGEAFGIVVETVKKLSAVVPAGSEETTVSLSDRPMRLISHGEILKKWGIESC